MLFKLNKGYGLLYVDKWFVDHLPTLTYRDLESVCRYQEYKVLKELISDHFS